MAIELKSNFSIDKLKEEAIKEHEKKLALALEDAKAEIHIRTKSQRDAKGGQFKALTPQYRKYKTKKGRLGIPNLEFSGKMLSNMATEVKRVGKELIGKIFFSSALEAAKARGNIENGREFFELSESQKTKISNKLGN